MDLPLISIIMPAFNAERYVGKAVRSVLDQSWHHWELIIINDGSTDGTKDVLASFTDPRIKVFHQPNAGVSITRNRALDMAQGDYVAFLDADDILPPRGLGSRAELLLGDPGCAFADGAVFAMDNNTGVLRPIHQPTFHGMAFPKLMGMSPEVFCGQTWMLRRSVIGNDRFPEDMRHAEDLAFYLKLARRGTYRATTEPVLHYRTGHGSAMSDLDGLDKGYLQLYRFATQLTPAPLPEELGRMWARIRRVMTLGFLKTGHPLKALRVLMRGRPTPPPG
jgi:glycosyltransferase involved in cell wall biosynthesis